MTEKQTLLTAFRESTEKLIMVLQNFPSDKFNSKPTDVSWSAAQVADHLLLLEKRINYIIAAPAVAADRKADHKVPLFRQVFENLGTKYTAPDFITPPGDNIHQEKIINALKEQKQKLLEKPDSLDLTELCADFPHHRLGRFTRMEWIYFTIYHTDRHIQQVKNIRTELKPGEQA